MDLFKKKKKKKEIYIYSVLHVVMCVRRRTAGEPRVKRLFDDTTQTGFHDKGFSTSLSLFRRKIKSEGGRKIQTMKTKETWNGFSCVQRESLSNVQKRIVPIRVLAEFVASPRKCHFSHQTVARIHQRNCPEMHGGR